MYNKYILSYQEIGDKMQIMMNLGDWELALYVLGLN